MLNNYSYYRYNNTYNRYNRFNPAFFTQNNYTPNLTNIQNNIEETKLSELNHQDKLNYKNNEDFLDKDTQNFTNNTNSQKNEAYKTNFRFGPLDITNERLSIFGFSIEFDDLLIIGLIFILLLDSNCDYSLIIVLGLILFNVSFSNLNFLKFV